jgi:FkbM family methyltransferase
MTNGYSQLLGITADRPTRLAGQLVRGIYEGREVSFFVENDKDVIQAEHAVARFYEREELDIIARFIKKGDVFLDIGTNVGNHTLYALMFLGAARAIVVEPNPDAIRILLANIDLNGLTDRIDTSLLGSGWSDRPGQATMFVNRRNNLGGGRLVEGEDSHGIALAVGDEALGDRKIDFIKIDVEGMELRALAGIGKSVTENRPVMFVEVDNKNQPSFLAWVEENRYTVKETYKRYSANENFLVVPVETGA